MESDSQCFHFSHPEEDGLCIKAIEGENAIVLQGKGIELLIPKENDNISNSISFRELEKNPWGSIKAFEFNPDGTHFSVPAKASFTLSDLALPHGVKKESLKVAVMEKGAWRILKDSKYKPRTGKLTADIKHFSTYGLVPEPSITSDRGMRFEENGVVARTSDSVYGRLFVSPSFVSFYAEADATDSASLTISGLPTDGEHHVYVNTHDDHHFLYPADGGEITIPLELPNPTLVWIQPQPGTIIIGGGPGVDECTSYGERSGDICTLTMDVIGNIELRGGTLDCNSHSITQPAAYAGSGIGVLVPPSISGTVIENCTIGSESGYFAYGIEVYGADTVVVNNSTLVDNILGILLQGSSNSFVTDNHVFGSSLWAITLWDSTRNNEIAGNIIDVDYDAILIEGLENDPPSAQENRIIDNIVLRGTGGILLSTAVHNLIKGNDISGVTRALGITSSGWPNDVYWNNFHGWSTWGVWSDIGPVEISNETFGGNWWGRSCPRPLFIPGEDSNREDVADSFPYGQADAWDLGLPPGCVFPGDRDGDGVPDGTDNCPDVWNPGQENVDGFGEGDACDVTPPNPPVVTYPEQGGIYNFEITIIQGSAELRSYVTVWDSMGVDEMGRSVRWDREDDWSSFIVNSVIAVDNLSDHIIDMETYPSGPGILVWHAGRYRASDVYLSYVLEEHILYPELYRHFAGMIDSAPQWTYDEDAAMPVIRDFVGELSTLCFPPSACNIHTLDSHVMPYKILYHITTLGQSGIVMRQAHYSWGPYSDKIPLFDCFAEQRALDPENVTIMFPESGGSCYGGFTHPDLWKFVARPIDPLKQEVTYTIKFNVSMWNPYKVLLVQTNWTEIYPIFPGF